MKYLLLDAAGTILHKPDLFIKINEVLNRNGLTVPLDKLRYNHKLLSEAIHFPDRTDASFYGYFNSELLASLGIVPTKKITDDIFQYCSYLPWEKFDDTSILNEIKVPVGIISNFNLSLKSKIEEQFGSVFSDFFVSEEMGISKPSIEFYEKALHKIGINAEDILYVGDSLKLDLVPSLQLGFNSYLIDRDNFYLNNSHKISSLSELKKIIQS